MRLSRDRGSSAVHDSSCEKECAVLVRGTDRYHHYVDEIPATEDLNPAALHRREALESLHLNIAGKA